MTITRTIFLFFKTCYDVSHNRPITDICVTRLVIKMKINKNETFTTIS